MSLPVFRALWLLAFAAAWNPSQARAETAPDPRVAALDAYIRDVESQPAPKLAAPVVLTAVSGAAILVGFVPPLFVGWIEGFSHGDTGRAPFSRPGYRKHLIMGASGVFVVLPSIFWLRGVVSARNERRHRLYQLREERRQLLGAAPDVGVSLGVGSLALHVAF